jgi:transcriptional regulator with XRE-family HTH domain
MTLALPHSMTIKPEDFNPPLKRKKPTVPYYWTVEELAEELGVSIRYVQYLVKGNPSRRTSPKIKAYKMGLGYLIADQDALDYLWQARRSQN